MSDRRLRFALLVDYLVSDYSECILKGVTDFCNAKDIDLFILPIGTVCAPASNNNYIFSTVSSHVTPSNFDGVIMTSGTQQLYASKDYLEKFIKYFDPVPVVNISIKMPGITSVLIDCETGFRALIEHLIHGHNARRFALMGVRGNSSEARERTELFKKILMDNNISLEDTVFWEANFDFQSAKQIITEYIKHNSTLPIDAIVALNDEMAFACIDSLKSEGFDVPGDVIVTGFDDVNRSAFSNPALSTVSQELSVQGYESAKALYDRINENDVDEVITIPTRAVIRHSCGCSMDAMHNRDTEYLIHGRKTNFEKTEMMASEWYTKRSQIIQATNFYTGATAGMTMDSLKEIINGYIRSFDIKAAAIVLYNDPMQTNDFFEHFDFPDDAYIFSAFDTKRNYETTLDHAEVVFNPKDYFLPETILQYEPGGFFIFSLYHSQTQLGYVIFQRGSYDLTCYDILARSISGLISSAMLFTENQRRQEVVFDRVNKLNIISRTDELTGLLNRRGFLNLSEQAMNLAETMEQSGLILYCDMDGLKKINDTFGHDSGDEAIKAEAAILRSCFRSSDIIGRIGGDEFAIVCTGLGTKEYAKIRRNIDKACAEWTKKSKSPFELSISIGVQAFPMAGAKYKIRTLMSEADAELYVEKRQKKTKKILK